MHYVYLLECQDDKSWYIGHTSDLQKRLKDHQGGYGCRVFHEKDIPIQVAVGNYDLGICSLDWIEELLAKYPDSAIVKVKDLMYGEGTLYVAAASNPSELGRKRSPVRIASEYPNLAEAFALRAS